MLWPHETVVLPGLKKIEYHACLRCQKVIPTSFELCGSCDPPIQKEFMQRTQDEIYWDSPEITTHFFIDELESYTKDELNLLDSPLVHVLAGEYYGWSDVDTKSKSYIRAPYLHIKGTETIAKILTICKIFPTTSAAKQAGYLKPIPAGYSELAFKKSNRFITFLKPTKPLYQYLTPFYEINPYPPPILFLID